MQLLLRHACSCFATSGNDLLLMSHSVSGICALHSVLSQKASLSVLGQTTMSVDHTAAMVALWL